ncbi:MAG: putative bifunctional diguanylate cyclase/phosphodiesterase [Hyphomonadaceae bacterium]
MSVGFNLDRQRDLIDENAALRRQLIALRAEIAQVRDAKDADPVTGLQGRGSFNAKLAAAVEEAVRGGAASGLVLLTLRNYRAIVDTMPADDADDVLRHAAERLLRAAGDRCAVARLSSEEFGVLVPEADERLLKSVMNSCAMRLSAPLNVGGKYISLAVALGGALAPAHARGLDDLKKCAAFSRDATTLTAQGGWALYDAAIREMREDRQDLAADLREAISADAIEPWFQPIVDAATGKWRSLEVLARWPHARRGYVSPSVFVPLAWELGVGEAVQRRTLLRACRSAAPWIVEGRLESIAFNFSAGELLAADFVDTLLGRLSRLEFPTQGFVVELTESAVVENMKSANDVIRELAQAGIKVALDDFGTGYSNLRSLIGLPISKLKLDQSLIADICGDRRVSALVHALIDWSNGMGISVVAEGVETAQQARLVHSFGAAKIQGFHYARPMPAEAIARALGER